MYVNTFFGVIKKKTLRASDRELGINLIAIGVNFGIVLSAVIDIILDATILKHINE